MNGAPESSDRRGPLLAGVWLVSLSILMLELTLTRLFSATMYYHFAFLAVSLALFGSGASGVFVYLLQRRVDPRRGGWLSLASYLFALSTVLALVVILANPLPTGLGPMLYRRLVAVYAAASLPFFFGGCAITLAIARQAADMGRLYLFDLTGAAAGCLLLIPVLNALGAVDTVLLVAVLAAASGALFAAGEGRREARTAGLILMLALGALMAENRASHRFDLREAKGRIPDSVLFAKWNSFSRVTVEGDLDEKSVQIFIDADASTTLWRDDGSAPIDAEPLRVASALAYQLKRGGHALIIGSGGGADVLAAQAAGMDRITAVEVNPIIAGDVMLKQPFLGYSGGLYRQPDVRVVVDEGRSFIRSSAEQHDVIQGTMVDTWAATGAGAFALTENYLYTVEAFRDYVAHLKDDGILSLTRWYFKPPDQILRLITVARAMMEELGMRDPSRHMMVVVQHPPPQGITPATFLFKKNGFTDAEVERVEAIARRDGFGLLYTPRTRPDNHFTLMIEAADPAPLIRDFATNIAPTRDNSPFFFNAVRFSDLRRVFAPLSEWHKTNLGTMVLLVLALVSALAVVLFILGPLALGRGSDLAEAPPGRFAAVLYFAGLGLAFILVEIALIQRFILFLGHPVYALSVVLFSLLAFCGLGSHLTRRFDGRGLPRTLRAVTLLLAGVLVVAVLALPPIFYGLVHLPRPARIAVTVAVLAPIAVLMGMPMPIGIRLLAARMPRIVPWAWGVNGAASVLGSVAALVLAIVTGFDQVLLTGAGIYAGSLFLVRRMAA